MRKTFATLTLLTVASATPLAALQQASTAPTPSPTIRTRVIQSSEEEVLRIVNELRAREARLLRELAATPPTDETRRRALEQQLAAVSRDAFSVMSVVESRCLEQQSAAPSGYIGLNITNEVEMRDREYALQRSVITSVEPGSPAEAAGIRADDRLVSVGGRDARTAIPRLSDLMEPGRRVSVVVERDGKPREFTVTVAPRPQRMRTACPEFERAMQPLRMGSVARVWVMDSADAQGNRVVTMLPATPRAPRAPREPVPATAPVPPTPPTPDAPMVFMYGVTNGGTSEVAYFNGAQFRVLDDDWRNVLGVRAGTEGVLVNEVAAGSAAAAAGLKAGDVVLSVDGTAATSPLVVVRLLSLSHENQTSLRVWRARETRTVSIRRNTPSAPRPD